MTIVMPSTEVIAKAAVIKLVIFDVDGVFTDGTIYVDDDGKESKAYNVLDGHRIKLLQQSEVEVAVISGRDSPSVTYRMNYLGIKHLYQGQPHKLPIYEDLLVKLSLTDIQVAYVGDDLPDIPLMRRVGLPIAVSNGVPEVKEVAIWTTNSSGGRGAIREVCELIMHAQKTWDKVIRTYQTAS